MISTTLLTNPVSTVAYLFLMVAIVSFWITPKVFSQPMVSLSFLIAALMAAYFSSRVTYVGVLITILFGFLCFAFYRIQLKPLPKVVMGLAVVVCAFLLGAHKLPGFKNWLFLSNFAVSADAMPIQLYLNFDKPLIGFYLMAFGLQPTKTLAQWKKLLITTLPIIVMASMTLLILSQVLGYVKLDLK